jgi:hypothetical protein
MAKMIGRYELAKKIPSYSTWDFVPQGSRISNRFMEDLVRFEKLEH